MKCFKSLGLALYLLLSAAAFAQNPNCTIIVPDNALSAQGLATPYQLTATDPNAGPCDETVKAQAAFVQAGILDPATGQVSIYNPLVINAGTTAAIPPTVPTLPANAIVAIWFGYNGDNLLQQGAAATTLANAKCVNGLPGGSIFGQFSYCNAPAFFKAANRAVAAGQLVVPPLGTGVDGLACPSVRNFFVVDQDQSDNLTSTYLIANGQLAQNTAVNQALLPGAAVLGNPSDNRLTDVFLDGALQCTPMTAPDLADAGKPTPALPLNELQAKAFQESPRALIPFGDPMVLDNGNASVAKLNLYRAGVDQPLLPVGDGDHDRDDRHVTKIDDHRASTKTDCDHIFRIAPVRLLIDEAYLLAFKSADADAANNLFTFMAQRFVASDQILGCSTLLGIPDPITVFTDVNGVAIDANIAPVDWDDFHHHHKDKD